MTSKQQRKQLLDDRLKKSKEKRRFYERNWEAMSWCNKEGFTLYVAAQANNSQMVKIFKQKGEKFLPLSNKLYDQENPDDVISYISAIDEEYERIYNLKKK